MTNALHLFEVYQATDGTVLTYGCMTHCRRYCLRVDPGRLFTKIRRTVSI